MFTTLTTIVACTGSVPIAAQTELGATTTTPETTLPPLECDAPKASLCDNEASIVRGRVSLAPGLVPDGTDGDLVLGLTHFRLGGEEEGGYHHIDSLVRNVDLADGPVSFSFDMCDGGEMWSEENCEYNLIAILDLDKNNGAEDWTPSKGEATGRQLIDLSCTGESPCVELVLDCVDGKGCVTFEPQDECACAPDSCNSPIATCL